MRTGASLMDIRHLLLAALASALMCGSAQAQPHTCGPGTVPDFGRWFSPAMEPLSSSHPAEIIQYPDPAFTASAMKLLIRIEGGPADNWNVVVRDSFYRSLATIGPDDFPLSSASPARWTGILKSGEVMVDLIAPSDTPVRVTVAQAIAFPKNSTGRVFSIVNPSHPWQELYSENTFVKGKRAGDSVGMISGAYESGGLKGAWCCSGVMLSATVMLTNWHCGGSVDLGMRDDDYWSAAVCNNTIVDLNWAKDAVSRKYGCSSVLAHNKKIDVALIRLGPVLGPDGAVGEPVHAAISVREFLGGEDVFVVHHSQCMQKLISTGCQVKSASFPGWRTKDAPDATDFTHNCNSESGASGAPVFDQTGSVIGLHHVGAGSDTATCKAITGVNKAIKMIEIVKFIVEENPSLALELGMANRN